MSSSHQVAKVLEFQLQDQSFQINSGLTALRRVWLDLSSVQGTLMSLLQQNSSKASILWLSAFFTVQLSHPYMTTGKTIALTRQIFVTISFPNFHFECTGPMKEIDWILPSWILSNSHDFLNTVSQTQEQIQETSTFHRNPGRLI